MAFAGFLAMASVAAGQDRGGQEWRLVPDLRIAPEQGSDYILEFVRFMSLGPEGRLYVGDSQALSIFVFDADGAFLHTIGREGLGPGEFQAMTAMGWIGDTLWVADRSRSQATFFTTSGGLVDIRRLPAETMPGAERPARLEGVLADGSMLALAEPMPYEEGGPLVRSVPVRRYSDDTAEPDTLLLLRRAPRSAVLSVRGQQLSTSFAMWGNSVNDRRALAPDGSSLAVVRPNDREGVITSYTVESVDHAGRLRFRRTFEQPAMRVTEDERDRWHAQLVDRLQNTLGVSRLEAVVRARDLLPTPTSTLSASYLFVGNDGRIWIYRRDRPGVLVVLDGETGDVLGRATTPSGEFPSVGADAADEHHLWTVELDDFRLPHIVRYRIEPTGER